MFYKNEQILHIGPSFTGSRGGGIEAVLKVYSLNLTPFQFIPSYTYGSGIQKLIFTIRFFLKLCKTLISNRKIRVLHIHAASDSSFIRKSIVVLLARLFGKKTILHMHGGEFSAFYEKWNLLKPYMRYIIRSNEIVICLSRQWFEYYKNFLPAERLRIVNNPVPTIESDNTKKLTGSINFLFLGLIIERKGIYDLLKAIASLDAALRNKVKLDIGGDGEKDKLLRMISNLQLQDNVRFRGWVNGELKKELFSNADVYILPSYVEGLPVSVLEAMSYGLPVIATNVGGIPEIVKNGENGYLLTPQDENAIAAAITKIIENDAQLEKMGRRSLELVRPYQDKAVFPALEEIYSSLLDKKQAIA